jgi:DNA polymerase III epsilon subunit-like protein
MKLSSLAKQSDGANELQSWAMQGYNSTMNDTSISSDVYISVDVETAGPSPSTYSLLTIGACTVIGPSSTFYVELKPETMRALPEALAVSRLSMERLVKRGQPPKQAMQQFEQWLIEQTPENQRPVFVAFNAPFDWMFVNDYFHRLLGYNPFGHAALDIKSYYMGLAGVSWQETAMRYVSTQFLEDRQLTHHALRDAMDQAEIFRMMLTKHDQINDTAESSQ